MKMNKNVKVGLGAVIFCLVISMFACSDKSAEIGNTVDQELAEQYPDLMIDIDYADEDLGYNCGNYSFSLLITACRRCQSIPLREGRHIDVLSAG